MITHCWKKTVPLIPAFLIGILLGACATADGRDKPASGASQDGGAQTGAQAAGGAGGAVATGAYNARIPLWDEAPPALEQEIPVLSISLELLDTEALAGAGETALEALLRETFYRGLSARDYTQEQIRVQTLEYRDMGEEARHYPLLINSASLNHYYEERFEVLENRTRLLVIARSRSFYGGGAHPNYDKAYFVFDRDLAMRIGLWDLLRNGAEDTLTELINRELRLSKKIGPGDSLTKASFLVDRAEPTENYFFSPQGLGFHWDPYEIAPYSEGYVEIVLPYAEIWELLGPEGRYLAREFDAE
ncbi:MAG: RsiV family protein [Treponema sp.]|jgi:hypothetical protein|nr:RsiV family protein [Treponema sp.]